jgi:hypothetical protein
MLQYTLKINKHRFNNYIFSINLVCFNLPFIIIESFTKLSRDPDLSRELRLGATAVVRTAGLRTKSHTRKIFTNP